MVNEIANFVLYQFRLIYAGLLQFARALKAVSLKICKGFLQLGCIQMKESEHVIMNHAMLATIDSTTSHPPTRRNITLPCPE